MAADNAGRRHVASFSVVLLLLVLSDAALADSSLKASKTVIGEEKLTYSERQATSATDSTIFLTSTYGVSGAVSWQAQTAPTRTFSLDGTLGLSVVYSYGFSLLQGLTLSNGTAYVPRSLLAGSGAILPASAPISFPDFNWGHTPLERLRLEGLPRPNGFDLSSAASSSASTGFPYLKKSAYTVFGSLHLYDNGTLYCALVPPQVGVNYVDSFRLSQVNGHQYHKARSVNADPAFLRDNQGIPPLISRIESHNLYCMYAFASNGKLYSTNCDISDAFSEPFNRTIDGLPALTVDEVNNIDAVPFVIPITGGAPMIYLSGGIYTWGDGSDFYMASKLDLSSILPTTGQPTNAPANVTHMASGPDYYFIIVADGRAFRITQSNEHSFDARLTSLIQSQAPGNSSSVINIVANIRPELVLLMADGTVWTYVFTAGNPYFKPFVINILDAAASGLWKSDLSPQLPEGFKIKRLIADAQGLSYGFLATSATQTTVPSESQPLPQGQRLFSPDPAYLTTSLKWNGEGSNIDTFTTYQAPDLNEFIQIAVGGLQILALTTNGSLLTAASSSTGLQSVKRDFAHFGRAYIPAPADFRSSPVYRPSSIGDMPFHVDPKAFGGKSIRSLTAGSRNAAALLEDASVAFWGTDFEPSTAGGPDAPSDPPSSAPISFKESDPYTGNNIFSISSPAKYISVGAMDSYFLLLDANGLLSSIGATSDATADYATVFHHDNILNMIGPVEQFSMSRTSPAEFWLIAGSFVTSLQAVRCIAGPLDSPTTSDSRFNCSSFGTSNFGFANVRAVTSGAGYMLMLHENGIFGIGTNAKWFADAGPTNTYPTPTLLEFPGLPPVSLIKSIHIYDDTLQILATDGTMYSSCSPDIFARCSTRSKQIRQIVPGYNISIVSRSGTSDPAPRIFAAQSSGFNNYETTEPTYLNLVFGAAASNLAWGSSPVDGSDGRIFLLPPGNPFESANATNIRLSHLAAFDYQVGATKLFNLWSSIPSGSNPDPQHATNPLPFPSPYQPSDSVVYYAPVSTGFTTVHQNCSAFLYVPTYFDGVSTTTTSTTASFPRLDPSQPTSSIIPASAPGFYLPTSRPLYIYQLHSAADPCRSQSSPIIHAYCDKIGEFMTSSGLFYNDYNFYCLMIAADGSLYARSSVTDSPSFDDCYGAMLGDYTSCAGNTTQINGASVGTWQVTTNKLPTPDISISATNIVDVSIAKKHVMILFTGGVVGVYGNNWRGQLGRSPSVMDNSTKLITVDLSIINNMAVQVLAMGRSSFALSGTRTQIASWGCNAQGQLGRITSATSDEAAFDETPRLVSLPTNLGTITDFECTELSCFVLYGTYGQVYSWGVANYLTLGRRIRATSFYDPIPGRADLLNFPSNGQSRVITDLITSKHSSIVIARAMIGAVTEAPPVGPVPAPVAENPIAPATIPPLASPKPSPPPSSCAPNSRPSEQFICQNGAWVSNATITVPTLTIPAGASQTIVNGSLESTQLVFQGLGSSLTVTGCANNLSSVSLEIPAEQLKQIGSKGLRQILLSYSGSDGSCNNLDLVQLNSVVKGSSCRDLKVEKSVSNGQLSALFTVNTSRCNTWWIILASVLASAVVIFCVVMILLVLFVPSVRECLRPYSKRSRTKASITG